MRDVGRTVVAAALGGAIALTGFGALAIGGCSTEAEADLPPAASGQPLDAIRYNAPSWAAGNTAWRVRDRQTGDEWWLVEMQCYRERHWVVLPRGEWDVNE